MIDRRSSIGGISASFLSCPVKLISFDVRKMTPVVTKVTESGRRTFPIGECDIIQSYISLIRPSAYAFEDERECLGTGQSYLRQTPLVAMGTCSTPNPGDERDYQCCHDKSLLQLVNSLMHVDSQHFLLKSLRQVCKDQVASSPFFTDTSQFVDLT